MLSPHMLKALRYILYKALTLQLQVSLKSFALGHSRHTSPSFQSISIYVIFQTDLY